MNVEFSPQSKSSGRSTLLLVGSGVLADTLAKHLLAPEVEVLRTPRDRMFEALRPGTAHLVVLVGDAAAERGAPLIRETVKRLGAEAPLMVVVTAPQIGGLSPQPMPPLAALLTPEGGMVECARRLRAMLVRLSNGALEQSNLQQVADETSRKATNASATQKIGLGPIVAPVAPQPAAAGQAPARQHQQTMRGATAPVPRPASTKLEAPPHDVPAAIGGNARTVPSIAAVVSKAVAAEPAPSVEMMWGESTPTVVARARSKSSGGLDLRPGGVELVASESPIPEPAAVPAAPSPVGAEVSAAQEASGPAPSLGSKGKQRQPTLHGQAPLSLSALAGAAGAVGAEVRIRTSSTQSMPKVTPPAPSGPLQPMPAAQNQAPRAEASAQSATTLRPVAPGQVPEASAESTTSLKAAVPRAAQQPIVVRSAGPVQSQQPLPAGTEASVEVSLASLEPQVTFSEAPSISEDREAPTPIAISIPAGVEPAVAKAARPRRSASRYVMAAVLVLVLGGGAAAAFKLMRPSEETQASAPVAPFGALAHAGSAREATSTLAATAKPEIPEPRAVQPAAAPTADLPANAVVAAAALPENAAEVPSTAAVGEPSAPTANAVEAPSAAPPAEEAAPEPDVPEHAAAVVAAADSELQEEAADADDAQDDAPAPNPAAMRAARLVDEGLSLAKQGRFGLAEASHLRALRVFPNYPRALAALVRVHLARKDGSEAVRWAKRLTKRQPTRAQNQLLLGDAQALRGDRKAARRAWSKAARSGSATARSRLKSAKI